MLTARAGQIEFEDEGEFENDFQNLAPQSASPRRCLGKRSGLELGKK
jgi:hypothetical protein